MPRLISNHGAQTHPLIWFGAIIFTCIIVAVIIIGVTIIIIYMVYKPKMPSIEVVYASLDKLEYDQYGHLSSQLTITISVKNDNMKSYASCDYFDFVLHFQDTRIAELRANPFKVSKNSTYPLNYVVKTPNVSLNKEAMDAMNAALKQAKVPFNLDGYAKIRWRVGVFSSMNSRAQLSCKLEFTWPRGISIGSHCSSKS